MGTNITLYYNKTALELLEKSIQFIYITTLPIVITIYSFIPIQIYCHLHLYYKLSKKKTYNSNTIILSYRVDYIIFHIFR